MTTFTAGTAATIDTSVLEELTYALVEYGQAAEDLVANNPQQISNITSSINRDTLQATIVFNAPCKVSVNTIGNLNIEVIDYLQGVAYTSGSGTPTMTAVNWAAGLVEAIIYQKNVEMDASRNPSNQQGISWSINNATTAGTANAVFAASLTVPVTVSRVGSGFTYKGASYLTGSI